jgi:hypothetical protein
MPNSCAFRPERKAAKEAAEKGRMIKADGDWRGDKFVEQSAALSR